MPRKKTRQQKEKTRLRRLKQLEHNAQKINEVYDESTAGEKNFSALSPSLSGFEQEAKFISANLQKVIILIILFVLLLAILVITENKYQYLSPLANNLMSFLLK